VSFEAGGGDGLIVAFCSLGFGM
jgi:hypothetical protein